MRGSLSFLDLRGDSLRTGKSPVCYTHTHAYSYLEVLRRCVMPEYGYITIEPASHN